MKELEEKYKKLFDLYDICYKVNPGKGTSKHIAFREVIRRLKKEQLNQDILIEALKNEGPTEVAMPAAVILIHFFLYNIPQDELFRLFDCAGSSTESKKVEKRIRGLGPRTFGREKLTEIAVNGPSSYPSVGLVRKLVDQLDREEYDAQIEKVLTMF